MSSGLIQPNGIEEWVEKRSLRDDCKGISWIPVILWFDDLKSLYIYILVSCIVNRIKVVVVLLLLQLTII